MTLTRRRILQSSLGAALLPTLSAGPASAQSLDSARVVVGFPAGSPIDAMARGVADKLKAGYARTVLVENRAGVGGQLAAQFVKTAPADGSTILLTPMTILGVYPHTYQRLAYDPQADFAAVSNGATYGFGVAVGSDVPASVTTIPQLMDWFKANPRKATFGTAATGSTLHFTGVLLGRAAGLDLTHVGYTNGSNMLSDLAGGTLPACVATISSLLPFHNSGRVRIIGTSGATRSRFVPNVATFTEAGYRDTVFSEWYGFFVPARTPQDVLQRLNTALGSALAQPDVAELLTQQALEAAPSTPAALAALLKSDTELWGRRVKAVGFTASS